MQSLAAVALFGLMIASISALAALWSEATEAQELDPRPALREWLVLPALLVAPGFLVGGEGLLSALLIFGLLWATANVWSMCNASPPAASRRALAVWAAAAVVLPVALISFMSRSELPVDTFARVPDSRAVPEGGYALLTLGNWIDWGHDEQHELSYPSDSSAMLQPYRILNSASTFEVCRDGWLSASIGRQGRCSWHGGASGQLVTQLTWKVRSVFDVWLCGDKLHTRVVRAVCYSDNLNYGSPTWWPFDADNFRYPVVVEFVNESTQTIQS